MTSEFPTLIIISAKKLLLIISGIPYHNNTNTAARIFAIRAAVMCLWLNIPASALHMSPQESGDGLGQGEFRFAGGGVAGLLPDDHAAQHVALGQDRSSH